MATSSPGGRSEETVRLLAIDGYSLMFRGYYAIPDMHGPSGPTNALFGFFRMLISAIGQFQPHYVAVALDHPSATFRDELYADYKGGRAATPDELRFQLEAVRGLLDALGIPTIEVPGYEADDVIATLTRMATDQQVPTEVVTGDRDILQLVHDPMVRVHLTVQGVSNLATMDEEAIRQKYGVDPNQYCDFAVLRGDKSDNLPGVRGIGAKTAANLLERYGNLDGILAQLPALSPRQRAALEEAAADLPLFRKLAQLDREVPLGRNLGELMLSTDVDLSKAERLFVESFGLRTVFESLRALFDSSEAAVAKVSNKLSGSTQRVDSLRQALNSGSSFVAAAARFDGEAGRVPPSALGFGSEVGVGDSTIWISAQPNTLDAEDAELLGEVSLVGIGLKELVRSLHILSPSALAPKELIDLGVLAYVLDASERRSDLREVAQLLEVDWVHEASTDLFDVSSDETAISSELGVIPKLLELALTRIEEEGVGRLANEIELPLVKVLTRMEIAGVAVDLDVLETIGSALASEAASSLEEIHALTSPGFNPNSPKQLGTVLFDELGLPHGRKTKTGYSTDARVLESLREHPLVSLVLRFRELDKLRSTFYEGLRGEIAEDGRIHATFNQTVARTGRISSEHPNLQNIPVRSGEGRQFRRVFVAPPGSLLVAADYSQIELRILAHLSQDPGLIQVLSSTGDVHSLVAASIYHVDPLTVSYEQRSVAKMVAYGLSYGMEAYGLATRLSIPNEEAEAILSAFFDAYPGLMSYRQEVVRQARELGYTTTLLGRRRYLPELRSSNRALRQGAERQAMNAPTQGLAADIFKMALVALDRELEGTGAQLVLQIHDEVVVEVPAPKADAIAGVVRETMVNVIELAVPLLVNVGVGTNWAEARE
ncbi:DNA polymerase I [Ferrimicrobium acidiphilum]|uniref:DNA polymerase I n=1 Tax=Ferrimicrobium acidiphilum DSM 19497 TaxID=1121877 RepID=A0A0D8FRM4_9ACTN|nr:DNA polymerase I [Ferrimicrobium acidiphilum]KJE75920.1 DNA polymerase I [Ferrimicrobium acidiphilum DSM 19497]